MSIPIVNYNQLEKIFIPIAYRSKRPLMIRGKPGIGKSAAPRAFVKRMIEKTGEDFGLIDLRALYMDPTDTKGLPAIDLEKQLSYWLPSAQLPLQRNVDAGLLPEKGILFLDELCGAPPAVQAALYELCLERTVNGEPLAEGWAIIAASNSMSDKGVVSRMPSPLVSRFSHVELQVGFDDWKTWAYSNDIPDEIIAYLTRFPHHLMEFNEDFIKNWKADTPYACPRSWEILADNLREFEEMKEEGLDMGLKNNVCPQQLVTSCIGPVGTSFHGYLNVKENMPTNEEVADDPKGVKMPSDAGVMYALTTSLVRFATTENIDAIFEFFQRNDCKREYEMVFGIDLFHYAEETGSKLARTKAFRDHTVRKNKIYKS